MKRYSQQHYNFKKAIMIQDSIEPSHQAQQPLVDEDKLKLHTLYGQARLQFIQKVFAVLGLQVICTVGTLLLMIYSQPFFNFQQANTFLFVICIVGWLVSYFLIVRSKMNRQYPKNIILLLIYTVGQSYSISYLCGAYLVADFKNIIFIAAMMTLAVVIACVIYAYKTKNDFTTNEGAKVIGSISLVMLLVFILFENENIATILICTLATGLYGMHLIINIQIMIGANERMLSVDDHMICALELYTNILQLFTCILMLLSARRNK